MRYENWKDLKPLEAPVSIGTKCVVIGVSSFDRGTIVFAINEDNNPQCVSKEGKSSCVRISDLAKFPTAEPAQDDYSTWRKREVWDCAKLLYASPEFGSAAHAIESAKNLMAEFEKRYGKCER